MAAPQIPNLNTFRRGRGRGRGTGHVENGPGHPTGKDRVVQGTDNDASVSRMSAVELRYLDDPYATALTPSGSVTRRFPIINRGTYVRTTAIDRLVTRFLSPYSPEAPIRKKQVISLGAGSDTRIFRLFSARQPPDIVYHELDFAVNTATKIQAIRSTPSLQRALGLDSSRDNVTVSEAGDALHSPSYHIHPVDLRSLSADSSLSETLPGVDRELPTLLISECCLIYLSPTEAAQVVSFFTEHVFGPSSEATAGEDTQQCSQAPLGLVLYEPIRPDDPFGRTMVSNLAARGIQLQTLHKYASLEAQRARLREHGLSSGQAAADIDFIWERWVSEEEKERVSSLEMLDEMEEWRLLARHYCIAWGWRDGNDVEAFEGWSTIQAQPGE
ncbi:uncharacterized protein N7498_005563 [Penicillium cinerascens]|uniref:Leucine carboxyl methyltransferase 1 n=1 Tax=Penicillium cinerascens TaxID=70096 RepID=A0A9W9MNS8_9EURO|nr:uncharacterized protein N7498_005563 [Penicillium cinerascens]KAJ5204684.1 hypothetical protein N7498_005563 [Penicillium cinerascens]